MVILIAILAVTIIRSFFMPLITKEIHSSGVTSKLMNEKFSIAHVGQGDLPELLEVEVERGPTELTKTIDIINITETVYYEVPVPTDIYLLVDLSGSMRFLVDYDCVKDGVNLNDQGCNPPGYSTYQCEVVCQGEVENGFTPISILKDSAHEFIDRIMDLNNDTQIALMGYRDTYAYQPDYPYLDFTNDSDALGAEVDSWEADGGTYLLNGMTMTYNNFLPREVDNKILIILGDGACTGTGCVQDSIDYAENFNDSNITVHTIGFGPNADTALFQGVANSGGGSYFDSSDFEDLAVVFRDIIGISNITTITSEEVSLFGVFLDIVVHVGGESKSYRVEQNLPGSNEGRTYTLNLEELSDGEWVVDDVTLVEVYIVGVSEGNVYNSVFVARYDDFD